MSELFSLQLKLQNKDIEHTINGLSPNQWSFFGVDNNPRQNRLFIFDNDSQINEFLSAQKLQNVLIYPDIGSDIYSSIYPSEKNLFQRFNTLQEIVNTTEKKLNICTTFKALHLFTPSKEFFTNNKFTISITDILSPEELTKKLIHLGYSSAPTVEEPGTFVSKGEIFDIYPLNDEPIRIHYFDDMIEEIFHIDRDTLKTNRNKPIESINIGNSPHSLLDSTYILNFRNNVPRPNLSQKELVHYRESLIKKLNRGQFFEDYPLFLKHFFTCEQTLLDFTNNFEIHFFNKFETINNFQQNIFRLKEEEELFQKSSDDILKPRLEDIYAPLLEPSVNFNINNINIEVDLDKNYQNTIDIKLKDIAQLDQNISLSQSQGEKSKFLSLLCESYLKKEKNVIITYKHDNSLNEIKHILQTYIKNDSLLSKIKYLEFDLDKGFYFDTENTFVITESDFFAKKIRKTKKLKHSNDDLFAEQISTLQIGDFVIHKEFGVGKYIGMETLELNGGTSDFLVIEYQDQDKVYVPVYRLNLVQKHSSKTSHVTVSNLKTKKFDTVKSRAKSAVKKLAFDLLELQAKRELLDSYAFSPPDNEYNEFELSFKFEETPDQRKAIDDILDDMQSNKPMDRLVCGDVGFGKTEIAMRAAFKAVLDQKQVCLLVPTTVLAYQHYNSFLQRFKDFPVNIEFISRFRTAKQKSQILTDLREGKIDILIGTHTILSDKVQFNDLGLIIIDEEQRFGVGHKEKLKLMKETVDTLTLTATPIPRTLQMSFLGIKDLSLIKTAPPKRQSIKTYLVKEDNATLQSAIRKELTRGGQVFIVHNKVNDIEIFTSKIKQLVPEASIIFAHGQLAEKELEKRITDFYNKKYDILISTTIIESGIDIPSANTMIIDRADTFGLSQLHQLRGRIGRSDKKAYAYFMIPTHKNISDVAAKRLKALQTYADLGSGFALASSDLEIRGSGDVLGPEQSGHIGNIGLELYMELLQDALNELKGENKLYSRKIEIQTPFSSFIPETYIKDAAQRLKFYKKISNAKIFEELDELEESFGDIFGIVPTEVNNLLKLMKAKIYFQNLAIKNIKVKSSSIDLSFDQQLIVKDEKLQTKIVDFFMQRPKVYKFNPNFVINCKFKEKITIDSFLDFAKYIAEQIQTC